MPRPRRSRALGVGFSAWLASVGVAWGVNAGTFPVAVWLDDVSAHSISSPRAERQRPGAPPPAFPNPMPEPTPAAPAPPAAPAVAMAEEASAPPESPVLDEPSALAIEPAPPSPREVGPLAARGSLTPEPAPAVVDPPTRERAAVAPSREPPALPPRPSAVEPPPSGPGSSDGTSCEAAVASSSDSIEIGKDRGPADLRASDYARVLNGGGYLSPCGVPTRTSVDVCVAVQNGRALGVTVRTSPRSPNIERCVARGVRRLAFPRHPRFDVARTRFAAE